MAVAARDGKAAAVGAPAAGGALTRLGRLIREVARRPAGLFGLIVGFGLVFLLEFTVFSVRNHWLLAKGNGEK